eukprot:gb/GEZN01009763.1/.p1 GENE.gb/GEZN01009763.1/~~gb/GEZN01009763.1/.p1  ORF type:complete len:299 (+),score=48.23 gb/GEZN01009763.1/:194-1090(+)
MDSEKKKKKNRKKKQDSGSDGKASKDAAPALASAALAPVTAGIRTLAPLPSTPHIPTLSKPDTSEDVKQDESDENENEQDTEVSSLVQDAKKLSLAENFSEAGDNSTGDEEADLASRRQDAILRAYDQAAGASWARKDYSHVLEVYDFPTFLKPYHLTQTLGPTLIRVEPVDTNHYLAIFRTPKHAEAALDTQRRTTGGSTGGAAGPGPQRKTALPFKLRSWAEAESVDLVKAELLPDAERPETNTRVASRLITGHLGMRTGRQVRSRAELDAERRRESDKRASRRAEKEKEQLKDAW